jgi:hypothetical protein
LSRWAAALAWCCLALVAGLACSGGDTSGGGSADQGPQVGDHWHARLRLVVCGQELPPLRAFPGGVHTHGDGYMHIHPENASEEGRGASLVKFFEYARAALGSGRLSQDALQVPGDATVYRNGEPCPSGPHQGHTGTVKVTVNGRRVSDVASYVPQDGDDIVVEFGP